MDHAIEKACGLEGPMDENCTELINAQTKFKSFKDSVIEFAQKRAKTTVGVSEKKRRALVGQREVLLKNKIPEAQDLEGAEDCVSAADSENQSTPEGPSQQAEGKSQEEIAKLIAMIEKSIDDIVNPQKRAEKA
jgi:hypothetical protein